ncbi:hypothetical protein [Lactiplantibacillus plantarum]|uniref:hypothetical protein n=1 Tax=Lactiplantibacillus plantarum TaxID=1590 RepID=UPI001E342877|nr:hypothetical protein [Lactiplantibacillus plantarum]WGF83413.1 hypothetical protein QB909_08940 [Lactiplantibacillus plantarum]WGG40738.1 hypothetical protein QCL57_08940 [Lactiplantibacillus plantarum]
MAKTLSFTDTSPQTVKIGDTTTSFTLICGNDNVATDLTNVTSITVKLGNASGYLKSATVDPTSLTDPTTGQVTVNFNADLMNSLPAGSYALEVWVVDSTGTSIYPSDGSTGFAITNNLQSTNGSTITTITFDDFVNKFNTIAANALPGTTDTTNFQKQKITADGGGQLNSITKSNGLDLNQVLLTMNGFQTFYVQQGATNNPSTDSMRGFAQVYSKIGLGIFVPTNAAGGGMWIATVYSSSVIWQNVTTDDSTKIIWNA